VLCLQLVIFGGQQRVDDHDSPIQQSTNVHVVDLGVSPLRWRSAPVANIETYGLGPLLFPCTSAVSVPGQQVVALKHNKVGLVSAGCWAPGRCLCRRCDRDVLLVCTVDCVVSCDDVLCCPGVELYQPR
jgi:hypothetical protein